MSSFLLINPPIYDFAAYDLWAKPLGLLYISAILRKEANDVVLLDCLDRKLKAMPVTISNEWGCGRYYFEEVPRPKALSAIPRKYKRYGLPRDEVYKTLSGMGKPDYLLVTSAMTYWYPGVFEIIRTVKKLWKDVPIILGGSYAALCSDHAREHSGADIVVKDIKGLCSALSGFGVKAEGLRMPFNEYPAPDYSHYENLDYAVMRLSQGCPFSCSYCAINELNGGIWQFKESGSSVAEIEALSKRGIKNIAFYDDALLYEPESHIEKVLNGVIGKGLKINFHTPNGLHAKFITPKVAGFLKGSNFIMPRISLETASKIAQKETGGKVSTEEYLSAVENLVHSGYKRGEYCAYIMIGMPGQELGDVELTIELAHKSGAHISVGEYSPIPKTREWELIKEKLPSGDPLWHNNSIFPLHPISDWPKLQVLKDKARNLNKKLANIQ